MKKVIPKTLFASLAALILVAFALVPVASGTALTGGSGPNRWVYLSDGTDFSVNMTVPTQMFNDANFSFSGVATYNIAPTEVYYVTMEFWNATEVTSTLNGSASPISANGTFYLNTTTLYVPANDTVAVNITLHDNADDSVLEYTDPVLSMSVGTSQSYTFFLLLDTIIQMATVLVVLTVIMMVIGMFKNMFEGGMGSGSTRTRRRR